MRTHPHGPNPAPTHTTGTPEEAARDIVVALGKFDAMHIGHRSLAVKVCAPCKRCAMQAEQSTLALVHTHVVLDASLGYAGCGGWLSAGAAVVQRHGGGAGLATTRPTCCATRQTARTRLLGASLRGKVCMFSVTWVRQSTRHIMVGCLPAPCCPPQ